MRDVGGSHQYHPRAATERLWPYGIAAAFVVLFPFPLAASTTATRFAVPSRLINADSSHRPSAAATPPLPTSAVILRLRLFRCMFVFLPSASNIARRISSTRSIVGMCQRRHSSRLPPFTAGLHELRPPLQPWLPVRLSACISCHRHLLFANANSAPRVFRPPAPLLFCARHVPSSASSLGIVATSGSSVAFRLVLVIQPTDTVLFDLSCRD